MPPFRLGLINYLNSLFFWGPLVLKKINPSYEWTLNTPAQLNQKILNKELDASMVSCSTYLNNASVLNLATPFCISARGPVLSVALFTPHPPEELKPTTIAVTQESGVSVQLLSILAKHCWGFEPRLCASPDPTRHSSYLLIGDGCLRHACPKGYYKTDLAQQWHQWTGLPFTFGVFAARTRKWEWVDYVEKSYQWSLLNKEALFDFAAEQLQLPKPYITHYFECLDFNLTTQHQESMRLFKELSKK